MIFEAPLLLALAPIVALLVAGELLACRVSQHRNRARGRGLRRERGAVHLRPRQCGVEISSDDQPGVVGDSGDHSCGGLAGPA